MAVKIVLFSLYKNVIGVSSGNVSKKCHGSFAPG